MRNSSLRGSADEYSDMRDNSSSSMKHEPECHRRPNRFYYNGTQHMYAAHASTGTANKGMLLQLCLRVSLDHARKPKQGGKVQLLCVLTSMWLLTKEKSRDYISAATTSHGISTAHQGRNPWIHQIYHISTNYDLAISIIPDIHMLPKLTGTTNTLANIPMSVNSELNCTPCQCSTNSEFIEHQMRDTAFTMLLRKSTDVDATSNQPQLHCVKPE